MNEETIVVTPHESVGSPSANDPLDANSQRSARRTR